MTHSPHTDELRSLDNDIRDLEALLSSNAIPSYVNVAEERAYLATLHAIRAGLAADESDQAL